MPSISSFYGIIIWMYWNVHNPPHFHAQYGDHELLITIADLSIYSGDLPSRALGMIEWASFPQEERIENWDLASRDLSLKKLHLSNNETYFIY